MIRFVQMRFVVFRSIGKKLYWDKFAKIQRRRWMRAVIHPCMLYSVIWKIFDKTIKKFKEILITGFPLIKGMTEEE
uniref:Uncharacterized protein n=1 Tax=Candidatus Kentrum sp. UNK TaxID=2126344 RepID=A0A451B5X8_9GAMM|nr:MAG: hypothetical protein BECKUNK1418G_GA0071005_101716 [Candidatus Kentron sp. UNK]VFK73681.1 MAG: hypothetical protein BECKUNK1418H_GA0071006_12511 [Candidatus Kentron sp. UNK]